MNRHCAAKRVASWLCLAIATAAVAQSPSTDMHPASSRIHIDAYNIDVALDPAHHAIEAMAAVTFTASAEMKTASFLLNPALRLTKVTDAAGQPLHAERVSTESASEDAGANEIRVTPSAPLRPSTAVTWTFTYRGLFPEENADAKAARAVQLAFVGEPVSYLLYAARWFPTTDSMTDRFRATMHVHVPAGETVFGSGPVGTPTPDKEGRLTYEFAWPRPGFPGTILVGKFKAGAPEPGANTHLTVYRIDRGPTAPTESERKYAEAAERAYRYFTAEFGPVPSSHLDVVELPGDTVPASSAPGIAAIAGGQMQGDNAPRLLANTLAHQWWGNEVSPAAEGDRWITNGMCRFAELAYLERTAKPAVFLDAILNVSASALAYDTTPLADATRFPPFSTESQARTYDKGAMIFRMLQWQIGDAAFQQVVRRMLAQPGGSISSSDVERLAETASGKNLRPFFLEWLHSTGAPTLKDNWTLYRLGDGKGYRVIGEITEDLDLFQMPVAVRIETAGKNITKRVEVSGPATQFTLDTASMPHTITLDPERRLLRNDPDMQVRVHILRGMNLAAQNDYAKALQQYREALAIDNISSLASYRMGEAYFAQRNYQAAADAFRDALRGDGVPGWTEVWSDLKLGEIFDALGQRERARNQYRKAIQTGDDTGGALGAARDYLQNAYRPAGAADLPPSQ